MSDESEISSGVQSAANESASLISQYGHTGSSTRQRRRTRGEGAERRGGKGERSCLHCVLWCFVADSHPLPLCFLCPSPCVVGATIFVRCRWPSLHHRDRRTRQSGSAGRTEHKRMHPPVQHRRARKTCLSHRESPLTLPFILPFSGPSCCLCVECSECDQGCGYPEDPGIVDGGREVRRRATVNSDGRLTQLVGVWILSTR
jgi:hypothetical protein